MRSSEARSFSHAGHPTAPLVRWLYMVAAIVVLIVAVGGITRLTESGLSITQWKPVTGILPPLSEGQWQAEFESYKRIPQYLDVNGPAGMTLSQYKFIYFWEWVHRLLARMVGMVFALPLIWFWVRGHIPAGYKLRLLALLGLGGLQGAVGWWMVSSGLTPEALDRVSHFRLAAHLLVALVTLGGLIWTALDLKALQQAKPSARLSGFAMLALLALLTQLFMGALVAGMRSGVVAGAGWFSLDAWPLMQGAFFPDGVEWAQGTLHALLNDPYLTHFVHRWWAWGVFAILVMLAQKVKATGTSARSLLLYALVILQVSLGIMTVWSGVALWLAVAHQLCGALLVVATVACAHRLGQRF